MGFILVLFCFFLPRFCCSKEQCSSESEGVVGTVLGVGVGVRGVLGGWWVVDGPTVEVVVVVVRYGVIFIITTTTATEYLLLTLL